jgi:hypothetical protein
MSERRTLTAAIFNASDDTVGMLKEILAGRGFRAFGATADQVKSGELNFVEFLVTHKPDVIVWDIAPPMIATGTSSSCCARCGHCKAVGWC